MSPKGLLLLPAPRGEVAAEQTEGCLVSSLKFVSVDQKTRHPSDPTASAHLPAGRREGQARPPPSCCACHLPRRPGGGEKSVLSNDYDSGMNDRTNREIRWLVSGYKEPRVVLTPKVVIVITLSMQFGAVFIFAFGLRWGSAMTAVWMCGFIAILIGYVVRQRKLVSFVVLNSFELCLWCRHPFVGLPDRSRCAECGKGYDRATSKALFKDICKPTYGARFGHVLKIRKARLWARALRERDRGARYE